MPKLKNFLLSSSLILFVYSISKNGEAFAPQNRKMSTRLKPLSILSKDLFQKMTYLERTGEDVDHKDEAAVSASLYLNPATSKLAPHVQVSWEPDAADLIKKLASFSNPNRPLMIGVVGIPGSGKSTSCEILAAYLDDDVEALVMPMYVGRKGHRIRGRFPLILICSVFFRGGTSLKFLISLF
jgi:hypothetical protein